MCACICLFQSCDGEEPIAQRIWLENCCSINRVLSINRTTIVIHFRFHIVHCDMYGCIVIVDKWLNLIQCIDHYFAYSQEIRHFWRCDKWHRMWNTHTHSQSNLWLMRAITNRMALVPWNDVLEGYAKIDVRIFQCGFNWMGDFRFLYGINTKYEF